MAISYPLSMPSVGGIANVVFAANDVVGLSQSPYTFEQQLIRWPGQRFEASVTLPPLKRDDAEQWVAFLLSLKGQYGTFYLGDPNCFEPQGSALTTGTNMYTYTEEFDNAIWVKTNVNAFGSGSVANAITGPFGVLNADFISETTTASAIHSVADSSSSYVAGKYYTQSIYIHTSSTRDIRLDLSGTFFSSNPVGVFSMVSHTVIGATGCTASIELISGGWYRVSITALCTSTGSGSSYYRLVKDNSATYTGDGVSGVYIFGAMLNVGTLLPYSGVVGAYAPAINGSGQTGGTINIDGLSPSVTDALKAGDYIQIGSGSTRSIHKCLTDVNTDSAGLATVELWPDVRAAYADGTPLIFHDAKGKFRLKSNLRAWEINNISSYGISFDCVEAI